jgi:hypothetical protein
MYDALEKSHIRVFLAVMGTATLILGTAYTMVQQSTRLSANDMPLALSQTVKNELDSGSSPNDVITSQMVNVASNNNPFIIITDDSKHVLASTATLNGKTPLPPQGVFDYSDAHGTDHFTWQPADKVRLATRVVTYGTKKNQDAGFIITGQSLQPYEDRINVYSELALASWFATLAWNYLVLVLTERRFKAKK